MFAFKNFEKTGAYRVANPTEFPDGISIPDMSEAERTAVIDAVFGLLPQMGYGMDFNNQQTPVFNNYQGMAGMPIYQGAGQNSGMLENSASIGQQQIAQGQIMNPTIAKSISK